MGDDFAPFMGDGSEIMPHNRKTSDLFAKMLPQLTFFLDVMKRCDFMSEELKDSVHYGTSISGSSGSVVHVENWAFEYELQLLGQLCDPLSRGRQTDIHSCNLLRLEVQGHRLTSQQRLNLFPVQDLDKLSGSELHMVKRMAGVFAGQAGDGALGSRCVGVGDHNLPARSSRNSGGEAALCLVGACHRVAFLRGPV